MMNLNFLDQMIQSLQQKVTDFDKKLLFFSGGGGGEWSGGVSTPSYQIPHPTIEDGRICLQQQTDDKQTRN